MSTNHTAHKGSVELFLLSECVGLPTHAGGFKKELYRPTGHVWPYEEFDGPWQIYRFAREVKSMERPFGLGDAIVIRFTTLNTITTLIPLSRRAPVLWNGEPHRVFEQLPGIGDVLLQLPRSFQFQTPSRAPHDSDS